MTEERRRKSCGEIKKRCFEKEVSGPFSFAFESVRFFEWVRQPLLSDESLNDSNIFALPSSHCQPQVLAKRSDDHDGGVLDLALISHHTEVDQQKVAKESADLTQAGSKPEVTN